MWYQIKRNKIVSRENYVVEACRNKSVLHVGAAQARDSNSLDLLSGKNKASYWLHSHLSDVSKQCIGIDYNGEAVSFLTDTVGVNNIFYADVTSKDSLNLVLADQTFDVIVLGEIIEHLTCGGLALRNLKERLNIGGTFIITVPSLLSLRYLLSPFFAREGHDEDHVIGFTPRLIEAYLKKEGLELAQMSYYHERRLVAKPMDYFRILINKAVVSIFPWLSEGMVVEAKIIILPTE